MGSKTDSADNYEEDLRKSKFETIVHEVNHVISEIETAVSNLKSWTKPTNVTRYILQATDSAYTIKEPLGVVLIIGAWNFPIELLLGPLVGALAAGNCVLLKPSEVAQATEQLVVELVGKYFDPGVVKTVHGDHVQTSQILKLPFNLIFYTGSTEVGKIVMKAAAEHLTPCVLELGGKCPVTVDDGFDLALAAKRIMWGKLINSGQVCVAPDYCIVVGNNDRRDQFTAECVKSILEFYGNDPINSEDYGRIINQKHFDRISNMLKATNGKVIHGGKTDREQLFIHPTVIEINDENDSTMKEEIFGPILPVLQLPSLDDAVKLIKKRDTPLASYLFTDSKKSIERFQTETSSGVLTINDTIMQMSLDTLPFGGVGKSGFGSYHGYFSFKAFTHEKAVLHRTSGFEKLLFMRYPPFAKTDKLTWANRLTSKIRLPL
ncbi:hypothetical protein M3Y97_00029400 [Aphelenchoides bicaudatus]|nr:hypothetical protein M3Y97_00029400 [Aphelenchoides bicaudatus]